MILSLLTSLVPVQPADAGAFDPGIEIKPGEEQIGVLNGNLLALYALIQRQRTEQYEPKLAESGRLDKVFDSDPSEENRAAALKAIDETEEVAVRITQLDSVFWTELFESFPDLREHSAGIRNGLRIVKYKDKEKPQQPHAHALVICVPMPLGSPLGSPPDRDSRS